MNWQILYNKKWEVIWEIRDKLKEAKMETSTLFENSVDLELMEEFDAADCQCEHPPYVPQCQFPDGRIEDHIFTCLKTEAQVENFKKILLGIIEKNRVIFNNFKNETIKRIEQSINDNLEENSKKIVEDTYFCEGRWRENLKSFKNSARINLFEQSMLRYIKELKEISDDHRNREERQKEQQRKWEERQEAENKEFLEKEKNWQEQREKSEKEIKLRSTIIKEINNKNFLEPMVLVELDLDSSLWSPYQNWINKVWKIEISQLENFKNQMLLKIDEARERKKLEEENNINYKKDDQIFEEKYNQENKEKVASLIEIYEKEIQALKENMDLDNPEQKSLLNKKENELKKLKKQSEEKISDDEKGKSQNYSFLPAVIIIGIEGILIIAILTKKKKKLLCK